MINFDYIWQNAPTQKNEIVGIKVGEITHVDSIDLVLFFNRWCKIVSKLLKLEKKRCQNYTKRQKELEKYRMCTFEEFEYLHVSEISEEQLPLFHIFKSLDCLSDIERGRYRKKYDYSVEGYKKFINDKSPKDLLRWIEKRYRQDEQIFPTDMLKAHTYIVAPTTSGKTTLLRHLIFTLKEQHSSYTQIILDPHGELSSDLLKTRLDDFVFLDLDFKEGYTFSINLFDIPNRTERTLRFAIENLVDVFNKVIETKFSGVQKGLLQHCIEFLMARKNSTMDDFVNLLELEPQILKEAQQVDSYFTDKFLKGDISRTRDAINRKWDEIGTKGIRPLLSGQSTIRLKELIDSGKTIVFNLSSLPESSSKPDFGKMLLTYIKNILFERGAIKNPLPLFLYIDECQVFVSGTYEVLLSQMRKFGVRLVLANQYFEQLPEDSTRNAIRQNTAIKVVRTNKIEDAKSIARVPRKVEDGERELRQYEFLSDIWYREPTVFKSTDFLLKSDNYYYTDVELEQLKKEQLSLYYKPIKPKREKLEADNIIDDDEELKSTKPPFDLHLGEDGINNE